MERGKFIIGSNVVYPSHGVGEVVDIVENEIAHTKIELYVVSFPKDNMLLKVPVHKSVNAGLRPLCNMNDVQKALDIIKCKAKKGNRMWSRRAQEYESKINSGNLLLVAEVIRDLYKNVSGDCSYSERVIYENALNRFASEVALVEGIPYEDVLGRIYTLIREKIAA